MKLAGDKQQPQALLQMARFLLSRRELVNSDPHLWPLFLNCPSKSLQAGLASRLVQGLPAQASRTAYLRSSSPIPV